jgi:hypothetical protein
MFRLSSWWLSCESSIPRTAARRRLSFTALEHPFTHASACKWCRLTIIPANVLLAQRPLQHAHAPQHACRIRYGRA